jgi:TATA-box binding protein (TBP) (component of TFIID and TFIIIB)
MSALSFIDWEKIPIIDYINVKKYLITNLPDGVTVSTMCASAKLGTIILYDNVHNYLSLSSDDILTVKRNADSIRTLIPKKKKTRRSKKKKKGKKNNNYFYNQTTVVVRVTNGPCEDLSLEPKINIKLFKNGSIQMSGCKRMDYVNIALNKIIYRLKQIKGKLEEGKIKEIQFVKSISDLNLNSFKVDMINSNYKIDLVINREKFYNLLVKKKIKASYEPSIRACVIVKYCPKVDNDAEKEISIFIFEKGNIIITGAKTQGHILTSFNYINNIIVEHCSEIKKTDVGDIIKNSGFNHLLVQ